MTKLSNIRRVDEINKERESINKLNKQIKTNKTERI